MCAFYDNNAIIINIIKTMKYVSGCSIHCKDMNKLKDSETYHHYLLYNIVFF